MPDPSGRPYLSELIDALTVVHAGGVLVRGALSGVITSAQGAAATTFTNAVMTAINALTPAADRLPYFTGASTAALATFTSFARTLLDDVDAATARATLGVTIGTNVQAYDAELAAIAGLTSAADKAPYFTGSGTAALADLTSFGRSLIDDANAAAALVTLGLPSVITRGTYTPTCTGTANVDSTAGAKCQYFRIGSTVHVEGRISVNATTVSAETTVGVSLPVASDLAGADDLSGVATGDIATATNISRGFLRGDSTNNRAELVFDALSNGDHTVYFSFTYEVI